MKEEQKIHELGWDHPDVYNPRRRELYAQKRVMGWKRVQDSEERRAQQSAAYFKRKEEEPETVLAQGRKNSKTWRDKHPEQAAAGVLKFRAENPDYASLHFQNNPEMYRLARGRRRALLRNDPHNDLTEEQWLEIKAAYSHRCVYCGRRMERLTMDHITPLSKGGSHTASNVVPACITCNKKKAAGAVLKPVQPMLLLVAPPKSRSA